MGTFANLVWANQPTIQLSGEDIARAAYKAGITDPNDLTNAVAIAKAESHWVRDGISGSNDYGVWQINKPAHPTYFGDGGTRLLSDLDYNAKAAKEISGGGKNWNAWYTYKPLGGASATGPYRSYLNESRNIVNNVFGNTQSNLPTNPVSNPVTPTNVDAQAEQDVYRDYHYDRVNVAGRYQAQFDERHRRLGTRSQMIDSIFAGPKFVGAIEPVTVDMGNGFTIDRPSQKYIYGSSIRTLVGDTSKFSKATLFFLFNPNKISMSYQGNPQILPIGALDESQTDPTLPMADSKTFISFDLLFDRMYEVMKGSTIGVLTDVRCLEQICGINEERPVMLLNPVIIHLGKPVEFHFPAIIQSWDVQYTHFSFEMVPMRATVSLTALRLSSAIFASDEDVKTYGVDQKSEGWRKEASKVKKDEPNAWEAGTAAGTSATTTTGTTTTTSNNPWVNAAGHP